MNNKSILEASCVLIFNSKGQVLLVSRPNKSNEYGLPGGKVDPNENSFQAAKRELIEEVGITEDMIKSWKEIYCEWCYGKDGKDYWSHTYYAILKDPSIDITKLSQSLEDSERDVVALWGSADMLLQGPFAEYNKEMIQAYNKLPRTCK